MTIFNRIEPKDKLLQRYCQEQQRFNHNLSLSPIKELIKAGAITSKTVIELGCPIEDHNYTWCKDCDEKGQIIRLQRFEAFRIAHLNSFFYWRKETIRTWWCAFDGESVDQLPHIHTQNKNKNKNHIQNSNKKQLIVGVVS